jgi:hypothetical protein
VCEETGEWHETWQQVGYWFSPTMGWVMNSGGLAGVSGGSCVIALRDDATHWMPLPRHPENPDNRWMDERDSILASGA